MFSQYNSKQTNFITTEHDINEDSAISESVNQNETEDYNDNKVDQM